MVGQRPSTSQHTDKRLLRASNRHISGVKAIDDISFSVGEGERVALIGKNGSGKTTLLHLLSGIIAPQNGVIKISGQTTSIININLGVNFEASGRRNILLQGLANGHSRKIVAGLTQQIIEFSGLGAFIDLPVKTYSAGMRMRLNFAIATAFEPDILFLDEWIGTGDAAFRAKATDRMASFVNKAGILLLASHNQNLLLDTCERGIWMEQGQIKFDGPISLALDAYHGD